MGHGNHSKPGMFSSIPYLSGDIWQSLDFHKWREMLLASHGDKPRVLLNLLQCTAQPLTANNYLTQNVKGADVEKPQSTGKNLFYGSTA